VTTAVRGALWPLPCLGVLVAIVLGIALPALDGVLEQQPGGQPFTGVFGGGASAARDVLSAIAGSLISVTGLTFSLTVVALQMSSSQYSPRLLQTFVTDRVVQLTLGQLVLTFTYALTVLRTVRTESATDDDTAFVPRLSVTVAYLLTLGSVVGLVLFLGHLARALRVETMLRDVHDEAAGTLARALHDRRDGGGPLPPAPSGPGTPLLARSSGFLVDVDDRALVSAAAEHRVLLRLVPRFGDSVVAGTPLAHVWPDAGRTRPDLADLEDVLATTVRLGFERTAGRDLGQGLRKVSDITVRALSPGINDPTTAVHALSHASALLGELVIQRLADRQIRDDDGAVRVVAPEWTFPTLLQVALEEPLQYAAGQPAVLRRVAALLREVAWLAPRGTVDDLLRGLLRRVTDVTAASTAIDEVEVRRWAERLTDALHGRWPAEHD
jgi:uncharacterized membrane protein